MRVVICALLVAAAARPVQAQVDLSGEWSARYHEDQEHRIPGPEPRRLYGPADQRRGAPEGGQLGRVDPVAARAPGEAAPVDLLAARACEHPDHEGSSIRSRRKRSATSCSARSARRRARSGSTAGRIRRRTPPHTWAGLLDRHDGTATRSTVETTHFKVGWIQRNGVAHSDQATMTEHFIRHGDVLTVVTVVRRSGVPRGAVHPQLELGARTRRRRSAAASSTSSTRWPGTRRATSRTTCRVRPARRRS